MVKNEEAMNLALLNSIIPAFENELEKIYSQDPVFREIASEYCECVKKRDIAFKETGIKSDYYSDTINELQEELLTYLSNLKPGN